MRTALPAPHSARNEGSFLARLLAALLAAITLLAACSTTATPGFSGPANQPFPSAPSQPASPSPSPVPFATFPLTLTDDEGGIVTLPSAPRRIVSLTPADTEIAFALSAGDRVVATTNFDDYPPEVTSLPHVASFEGVDVEKVVGLTPDLVLAGGNGFTKPDAVTKLRSLHIQVLVTYAKNVAGVLDDIRLIGQAIGEPAKAADLAESMQAGIDQISAATATLPHPRTFYELDATKEIYGPAPKSFVAEMVTLAGGEPITTGNPAVFSIPLEKLVAADPEVIVLGDANFGTTPAVVKARPGWAGMAAVKAGAVVPIDDTTVTRPGPRLVEGLRRLALAIHPDLALPDGPSPVPSAGSTASPAALVGTR